MSKKPEAIKLANILQYKLPSIECLERSAAELRRLHAENIDLRAANKLDAASSNEFLRDLCKQAAKEIKELDALRLRRGKQEPVVWMYTNAKGRSVLVETNTSPFEDSIPLYTHPPKRAWQGLTKEERKNIWSADQMTQEEWDELFDTVEAKLKEKNT